MGKIKWSERRYFGQGAEASPFLFNGREYYLLNISAWHNDAPAGTPDHSVIVDAATHERGAHLLESHYFTSAFMHDGVCHAFGVDLRNADSNWCSHLLSMSESRDLVHWSEPRTVLEHGEGYIFNTNVVHDGGRFVMLLEIRDPGEPFQFIFFESHNLLEWTRIPGAGLGADMRYIGAPFIWFDKADRFYYVTYLNEFDNPDTPGLLNYDTRVARSANLVQWEFGNEPVLVPDYSHPLTLAGHPELREVNVSDAEFIEVDGKVKAYAAGGNQLGAHDYFITECEGSLGGFFRSFFE